jgi:hypothetical protein
MVFSESGWLNIAVCPSIAIVSVLCCELIVGRMWDLLVGVICNVTQLGQVHIVHVHVVCVDPNAAIITDPVLSALLLFLDATHVILALSCHLHAPILAALHSLPFLLSTPLLSLITQQMSHNCVSIGNMIVPTLPLPLIPNAD